MIVQNFKPLFLRTYKRLALNPLADKASSSWGNVVHECTNIKFLHLVNCVIRWQISYKNVVCNTVYLNELYSLKNYEFLNRSLPDTSQCHHVGRLRAMWEVKSADIVKAIAVKNCIKPVYFETSVYC